MPHLMLRKVEPDQSLIDDCLASTPLGKNGVLESKDFFQVQVFSLAWVTRLRRAFREEAVPLIEDADLTSHVCTVIAGVKGVHATRAGRNLLATNEANAAIVELVTSARKRVADEPPAMSMSLVSNVREIDVLGFEQAEIIVIGLDEIEELFEPDGELDDWVYYKKRVPLTEGKSRDCRTRADIVSGITRQGV